MLSLFQFKRLKIKKLQGIVLVLLFASVSYFAAAGALFCFLKYRRDRPQVHFSEILLLPLPGRWAAYEAKQGQLLISDSAKLLNSGQTKAAMHALQVGLAKAPGNREGLLLLAQLQENLNRLDLAESTLIGGLQYRAHDLAYLRSILSFLFFYQRDKQAFALCSDLLRKPATSPETISLAAYGAATACYYRGDYAQAENLLLQHRLLAQREGRLLFAKIQWEIGYRELALHQLKTLAQELPHDEEIYAHLITYLREDSRLDEARQLNLIFQVAQPRSPLPRINLLRDALPTHSATAWQQEADATLRYFAQDTPALLALAEMAATTGQPALARQIQTLFRVSSPEADTATLLTIEALIVAKDYPSALATADALSKQTPPPATHLLNICAGLQTIAHFGNNEPEAARLSLNTFLASRNLRATNLAMIADRLIELDARQAAREVLARAVAVDSSNQAALTRLIELDLEARNTEALPAHVRQLLTLRKPARAILQHAQRQLGSDRFIFSRESAATLEALTTYLSAAQPTALRSRAN